MDTLDRNPTDLLRKIASRLLDYTESNTDHLEIWRTIGNIATSEPPSTLKQLIDYFSQLKTNPQTPHTLLSICTLESLCRAYHGEATVVINELQQLMHKNPDSSLVKSAYTHILQNINQFKAEAKLSPSSSDPMTIMSKALQDLVAAQTSINALLLKKINTMEEVIVDNFRHIKHQFHDTKQTLNMTVRRTSPNRKIRCVFLVSFLQSWNTIADVYYGMKETEDFEPIVVSTARKYMIHTHTAFGEELVHDFLESEGVPHIRLNTALKDHHGMDILKALDPDIIFRQSPMENLPPVFNPAEINFARLCYIPYSFTAVKRVGDSEPIDAVSSTTHTNLYFHRICWRIFCETEMHKNFYIDNSTRAGQNVVVTGYPKFDRLLADKNRPPRWPITDSVSTRRRLRVIWAPHHSIKPEVMAFGTFIEVHKEMLAWAKASENDYEFVLKPHPALYGEVVDATKLLSKEYMDNYLATWKKLPNATIYESGDYGPLFQGSDVMLTDGVGFLSEYQLFEKPIIFLDSGRHFGFNPVGDMVIKSANTVKTISEAQAFCERLKNGNPDPMREIQKNMLKKIVPYPGQSAARIIRAIQQGLIADGVLK